MHITTIQSKTKNLKADAHEVNCFINSENMMLRKNKFQGYNLNDFDFLDLGSGTGESITYCEKKLNAQAGLGIDIKESKVESARENGIPTILGNILEMDVPHRFRFVSMMDFLEHLPSKDDSKKMIKRAAEIATDFLFIRHPSFEDLDYLKELGLKVTWYDWKGHTSLMTVADYCLTFAELGIRTYCMNFRKPIEDSSDKFIVPYDAPIDTVAYDSKLGEKPKIKFPKPLYGQIDIFVALRPFERAEWNQITTLPGNLA